MRLLTIMCRSLLLLTSLHAQSAKRPIALDDLAKLKTIGDPQVSAWQLRSRMPRKTQTTYGANTQQPRRSAAIKCFPEYVTVIANTRT